MGRRIVYILIVILIGFSFAGCNRSVSENSVQITFRLDLNENYRGFEFLPKKYTPAQAQRDGCLVKVNNKVIGGAKRWDEFIANSSAGKNSGLRIVNIWNETLYFSDLFFSDGYYRVFHSDSENQKDKKFSHILDLEGELPNAEKSGRAVILTDDLTLTYKDVMWTFFSSDSTYSERISPFALVFLE